MKEEKAGHRGDRRRECSSTDPESRNDVVISKRGVGMLGFTDLLIYCQNVCKIGSVGMLGPAFLHQNIEHRRYTISDFQHCKWEALGDGEQGTAKINPAPQTISTRGS
jgi:hypothetical protein